MGFTKLDERILQSSIMAESATTFKVWIALLAACRENGIAYVSSIYLSSICHLPLSKVDEALLRLESPDEHSRSLADEGRRIRRVDGGYEIINYSVYRDTSLKYAEAERKRLYRQRIKGCPDNVPECPDASASASSSASASEEEGKSPEKGNRGDFDDFWSRYPRKHGKQDAASAYKAALKTATHDELMSALDAYKAEIDSKGTEEQYIKHAATFLRKDRWRDYLPSKPLSPEEWRARQADELRRQREKDNAADL